MHRVVPKDHAIQCKYLWIIMNNIDILLNNYVLKT